MRAKTLKIPHVKFSLIISPFVTFENEKILYMFILGKHSGFKFISTVKRYSLNSLYRFKKYKETCEYFKDLNGIIVNRKNQAKPIFIITTVFLED